MYFTIILTIVIPLHKVHPNEAPIVVFGSFLSLASGGTVGPEAALGWMGCATAQVNNMDSSYKKGGLDGVDGLYPRSVYMM